MGCIGAPYRLSHLSPSLMQRAAQPQARPEGGMVPGRFLVPQHEPRRRTALGPRAGSQSRSAGIVEAHEGQVSNCLKRFPLSSDHAIGFPKWRSKLMRDV